MLVKSLRLNDYRNYHDFYLEFDPHLNIITGKNGIGKTNILESILVVSNTKSYRCNDDKCLINKDKDYARIILKADKGEYKVVIGNKNKSLYFNNSLIHRTSEYIGKLNAILFKPDDLQIFNETPAERRKLLDIEIGKVNKNYLMAELKYHSLLKDKNRLLKEEKVDSVLLDVIEESMIPCIEIILRERIRFFEEINRYISDIYYRISNKKSDIKTVYKKCSDIKNIREKMILSKDKDMYYHYATFGPHHDDFCFEMDGIDVNNIASQGQKRMIMIAFRFAVIEYIISELKEYPIVLLDDILSELDKNNQERLLRNIPEKCQIIITNTDINKLNIKNKYKHIELKEEKDV
ncbi:MAG: DNA replication and repair protein RecF [Erysipelotrichaceae bacterium]|nr:DNA replication and repair protein RecF [Erysipelotrichaceae bacterium]